MKTIISTDKAPAAVGPYCQAVLTGNMLFTSGQIAIDPATGKLTGETVEEQTQLVLSNMDAVLTAAGFTWDSIVKTTLFISDMNNFAQINKIYAARFAGMTPPARCCVEVARLPLDALIEMECIAVK